MGERGPRGVFFGTCNRRGRPNGIRRESEMKKVWIMVLALCLLFVSAQAQEEKLPEGIVKIEAAGAQVDLDGDGVTEQVSLTMPEDEYGCGEFTVTVNGKTATEYGECLRGDMYALTMGYRTYLLVSEDGPSDDPYSHFFAYDGESVKGIGGVPAYPERMELGLSGITAMVRGSVLQTWYRPGDFIVATGGAWDENYETYTAFGPRVVEVPRSVYPMGTVAMVKKGLTLQVSPTDDRQALRLKEGTRCVIAATDDVEWLYIVNDDETNETDRYIGGWIRIDGFSIVTDEGTSDAWDVFDGLSFAD